MYLRPDWAAKNNNFVYEIDVIFVCNTPKKTDCSKKTFFNAVMCEKNDAIDQNNVKLCDFIGKTISQLLEAFIFRGLLSQMNGF